MHSIQQRPVGVNGEIVLRPMMYVALSYDHRIVDGRGAVTFLKHIKDCVETPERVLLAKQQVAKLKDALAELPERVRFVFLLHRYEGMKYREIAQHLGISVSSVEKYMMQAIKHVAKRLGRHP